MTLTNRAKLYGSTIYSRSNSPKHREKNWSLLFNWHSYAAQLVAGWCPAVWVNVCHFLYKWKHLDAEVCPEVRTVEALTHKVAGRQLVEEMSWADWWRQRRATRIEGPHTHTKSFFASNPHTGDYCGGARYHAHPCGFIDLCLTLWCPWLIAHSSHCVEPLCCLVVSIKDYKITQNLEDAYIF